MTKTKARTKRRSAFTMEELEGYVGSEGLVEDIQLTRHKINNVLSYKVKVLDVKAPFGRPRFKVQPIAGEGHKWTQNIIFKQKGKKARVFKAK